MKPCDYAVSREIPSLRILTWRVDRFIPGVLPHHGDLQQPNCTAEGRRGCAAPPPPPKCHEVPVCRGLWSSGSFFDVNGLGRFKIANVNT